MTFFRAIQSYFKMLEYLPLLGLFLLLIGSTAGLLSAVIAKRRGAFVVGLVAYAAFEEWLRVRHHVGGASAMAFGYGAAIAVGFALRRRKRVPGEADAVARGTRRGLDVAVVVVVLVCSVAAVASNGTSQANAKAVTYTRIEAESIAKTLDNATPASGHDLAFEVPGPNVEVLKVAGNRNAGGADVVVRINIDQYGVPSITQCWHIHLVAHLLDQPLPVACPAVTRVDVNLNDYNERFGSAVTMLPGNKRADIASLRQVAQEIVDHDVKGGPIRIEVARVNDHVIGVAVTVGLAACVVTSIDSTLYNDPSSTESPVRSWRPEREQLGQGTVGCDPKLAVH